MEDCPNAKRGAAATAVASLPDELFLEILARVPARSIHRFKCVSKRWRDLIADPLHQKLLPQTLGGFLCNDAVKSHEPFISLPGRPAPLIDASFSFLTKLPEMKNIHFFGSCNGLVLFERRPNLTRTPSYVVCNPATKQWVAVPSSSVTFHDHSDIYLIFDPAASPHFYLLHIWHNHYCPGAGIVVRVYSSETRGWSDRVSDQLVNVRWGTTSSGRVAFVSGMLYFIMWKTVDTIIDMGRDEIVAMDREGKPRIIPLPDGDVPLILFVAQSQGRLHCMMRSHLGNGLNIWVLEDYDAGHWVLKHSVSYSELLGKMCNPLSFTVVSIHPDCDRVFFIRYRDLKVGSQWKLLSYDMHSKELHTVHNFRHVYCSLTPYVPYFSESTVLANMH